MTKGKGLKRSFAMAGIAVLGSLLALTFVFLPADAQARNIKVGVIDCYSGPPAVYANDALNGFKMGVD